MILSAEGYDPFTLRISGSTLPEGADVWWAAKDQRYANYDPWAEYEQPSGSHLVIELTPYIVVRYTPKGVVVRDYLGFESFVNGKSKKQLCVPTQELALQDLIRRKEIHVSCAKTRLNLAEQHLAAAFKSYKEIMK